MLEGTLPDAAGQPVPPALLHDLEEVGLRTLPDLLAGLDLHRHPARVGLHAAASPAGAARSAALDHDVADLPRGAAAEPLLTVEDQPAADAGSPPDPEDRLELLAGAQLELALDRDRDVVADPHRRPELAGEVLAERETARSSRAGCGRRRRRRSPRRRRPGDPTPTPERSRCRAPPAMPPRAWPPPSLARRPPDRPEVGVGRRDWPRTSFLLVNDDRLDLGPAEIDSAPRGLLPGWAHGQTISLGSEGFGKL